MKTVNKSFLKTLMIGAVYFGLVMPVFPDPSRSMGAPEVQRITITGATGVDKGELTLTLKNGEVGIEYKSGKIRHRMFALIDRTQMSQVTCDRNDAEYGAVTLKDGSWIAVAVCGPAPSKAAGASPSLAIPALVSARASAAEAGSEMKCWENKDLMMGVCIKASSNPPAQPMPRTREHILLARQVG
jgi:hypothetical protein